MPPEKEIDGESREEVPRGYISYLRDKTYTRPQAFPLNSFEHAAFSTQYSRSFPENPSDSRLPFLNDSFRHIPESFPTDYRHQALVSNHDLPHTNFPQRHESFEGSFFGTDQSGPIDKFAERQRKRKENHNAVERKRRIHINDMIRRLSEIVPGCNGVTISDSSSSHFSAPVMKLNKGDVLQCSVEYISHLQKVLKDLQSQIRECNLAATIPDFSPSCLQNAPYKNNSDFPDTSPGLTLLSD